MQLLAINYHYIDDPQKYKAGIYPVSPDFLARQIDHVGKQYTFISEAELVAAIRGEKALPEKSAILTFDDGLKCQYENALPVLEAKQAPAVFFIPTRHLEGRGYVLHKIHYLLSQVSAPELIRGTEKAYKKITGTDIEWSVLNMKKVLDWYRYDKEPAAQFKYMLNHCLPFLLVEGIVSILFEDYVSQGEDAFCKDFYLSETEIKKISTHSLIHVGLHTHAHLSIEQLPKKAVEKDIKKNFNTLRQATDPSQPLGISYPFGAITEEIYNEKVKEAVEELGLEYAFTIEKKINRKISSPFLLGRFNPNDVEPAARPLIKFTL